MAYYKSKKAYCIEKVVKARRLVYKQKEIGYYLGLTTKEVQELERAERKLTATQIHNWAKRINIDEEWIIACGFWNKDFSNNN
jgi:transcriptional regulator with XRE-family HTH domain